MPAVDEYSEEREGLRLPVAFRAIPESRSEPFTQQFKNYHDFLVRAEPGGFVLTPEYGIAASEIYQLRPRKDDVWVLTFPKCGTTWVSEIVWMLMNDCNFEASSGKPLSSRVPFLELPYLLSPERSAAMKAPTIEQVGQMPSPRVLKSHLPFYLLHPKLLDTSKVVYVARNPKDVIVSFYYQHQIWQDHLNFVGDIEQFASYFMDNQVIFTPFFPHFLDAWSKRNHPNMYFVFYEDLKKNLRGEIRKMANFLGRQITEDQLSKLTEHSTFEQFSKNDSVNMEPLKKYGIMKPDAKFVRKGTIGDWKNHFSPELNNRIDAWIDNHLTGTEFKFFMELMNKN